MKNPVKNGKEVFAVLSMATVMSISMSVKVDAASSEIESKTDIVAASAAHAVGSSMDKAPSEDKVEETIVAKEDTTSADDKKDTEAIGQRSSESARDVSETKAEGNSPVNEVQEKDSALEVSGEKKYEAVRAVEGQGLETENTQNKAAEEKLKSGEEEDNESISSTEEKSKDEDGTLDNKASITSETSEGNVQGKDREAEVAQAEDAENSEENLEIEEEKPAEAQKAEPAEPNYSDDEKKIKDYSGEERYRSTQMEQGNGPTGTFNAPEGSNEFKDGFRYNNVEPSVTSPDKKKWGIEIELDKEKGQRTYTDFTFTNSGLLGGFLNTGNVPANEIGDKLSDNGDFKDPNYKANTEIIIDGSRQQRNLNLNATEEDLKHINSIDTNNTTMAWEGKYTKDPTVQVNRATQGENASFSFTVNPWPNENDSLELMKLNGEYNEKVFVQGQEFDTGIKIDNIDDNARERLVGQVYHPTTGEIVPGAKAYIKNGTIHIKMPKGALKKDPTGLKYVVDDESIFSTDAYKGLQNLDVKFFARPRTADEFRAIVENNGGYGYYTETGAGTETINHEGKDVVIDKQGIDRYDHYNLIGGFKLNLDDTRYYTQKFVDGNNEETDDHKFSRVYPGQDFEVKINNPSAEETDKTRKTDGEMDKAYKDGQASGKLNDEFLEVANRQIAENLGVDYDEFISNDEYKENRWSIDGSADNISHFKIHAPKNAKAGDFLAVPIEYTYTNGSTDTHWFHFVVQETNNNRPEYLAEVGPQGNVLVNKPIIPKKEQDLKKNQPESYELIGNTFKDNKGNVWNVSIDQKTGAVTATLPTNLPEGKEINGGEKLTVPVKVKYTDQTTGEERTEEIKAQFIATKQFKTQTSEKLTSEIPFEIKVEYDPNLPEGYFQEFQKGQNGELTTTFIQDTLNGKKGLFQTDGTFVEGDRKIEATVTREATPRIIKIGTMPSSTTIEIPFDTEYEVDDTLAAGETKVVNDGEKGEVTITTSREEDGTVKINKETTKEAKNKKIKIGTKTQGQIVDTDKIPFKYKVEFDPDFYTNYPDATENYKIVTPGIEGENTKTWTIVNSEKVGDPEVKITDPVDAVIKVGQKDYTGTVTKTIRKEIPFTVKVVENPELEAGKSNVKQEGQPGSRTYEYSGEIFNGGLKEGTELKRTELEDQYVAPTEHIIEIGTKPVKNSESITNEVDVKVNYIYDKDKEIGYLEVQDLVKGKVTTVVENEFDPKTGEIKTVEKTVVEPGTRTVIIGTKNKEGDFTEEINKIIPFETIIQFDDNLAAGTKETVQIGENGATKQTITRTIVNGEVTEEKASEVEIVKEVKNQIIKVGTMTDGEHSYTEEIPFETKVEKVSDLKKGEWRYKKINGEEQKGKLGSRTTEWTIVNSKITKTNVVKDEKPVDAIIEIGDEDFTGNVSHEVTEALPFDVKVIEDPDMIAGTSKVVTEGKAGSKTTKYTQGIKNGEKDGDLKAEVTSTKDPVQQVIKVGTKPAENNKDYSKEVGVKVEYVYDSSLKMGVFKDGGLTPGKVETKIVNKYDPATGKITTTEEEVVTEAVQKIIVGTQDFTGKYPYESTTEIPFKVVVKEDPNLAKGQSRVEQEGKAGSKTTYYEIAIKNGEKVGDPIIIREVENDQPLDHIIYVGTKVAESSTVETVEKDIPYETKITYDENLDAGSQVVDKEGVIGKEKVTVTTNITDGNGETSKTTETIKYKEDRIVRVGVKPVVKETELGNNTEYKHNPELKVGEEKVIEEGSKGSVKYTTTFNKETGKLEVKEERVEPKNKVVEYGSKTDGEFTYESEQAYDIKVIEDPNLEAGKTVVDKEGIVGKTKTTVKVENSKKVSENTETLIEKQDKIVRVGTKNVCEIPPVKPGEDPKDPDKDPGKEDPKDPDKDPGEEDSKNPDKDPGKEDPKDPDKEPGEEDSKDPDKDPDKGDPNKPGNNTPSKPGNKDPFRPGEDKPNQPSEPSDKTPNKPEDKTPNKIVENPSEDPKDSPQESPEKPKTEDVKDIEKNSTPEETREVEKKENLEDDNLVKNKGIERQVTSDDKAPKTGDAGLAMETASAGLASGLLLLLKRFKRRKEDEE